MSTIFTKSNPIVDFDPKEVYSSGDNDLDMSGDELKAHRCKRYDTVVYDDGNVMWIFTGDEWFVVGYD